MLNESQVRVCEALVGIFETGRIVGDNMYGQVTLLQGDTGGLTYGKHQTTINSGNLYLLIKAYCEDTGSDYRAEFAPYMARLISKDPTLGTDQEFCALLHKAGSDLDMQQTQDAFFRRVYWNPASNEALAQGFSRVVSYAIVYDSFVHGSYNYIKGLMDQQHGPASNIGELAWIRAYNNTRRNWLANHVNPLLRKTVYRQDAFNLILNGDNWDLHLPFKVRGVSITAAALGIETGDFAEESTPVQRASGEDNSPSRLLMINDPIMRGDDVAAVKEALAKFFYPVTDGDEYDPVTVESVRLFQTSKLLRADGIVGNVTRKALGIG